MHIIELSKLNLDLSLAEAQALLGLSKYDLIDQFLFTENKPNEALLTRLAYSRFAYKELFISTTKSLLKDIETYNFNRTINKSYKVFYRDIGDPKKKDKINSLIWHSLKNPKVDIKKPEQELHFIKIKNKIYCCLKVFENKEDFDSRAPHKRLGFRPISMHPRLARCLVNLSGCKKRRLYDPMTGMSGILLEGIHCGLDVVGYDINEIFLRISRANFIEYKFKASRYEFKKQDFFKLDEKISYIASDLPYGKNTKNIDSDFYEKFLKKLDQILKKRAVIVFPETVDVKALFKKTRVKNITLKQKFNYYVHCSMSRVICVIEKNV